jgi:gliding motility-associated-like protein
LLVSHLNRITLKATTTIYKFVVCLLLSMPIVVFAQEVCPNVIIGGHTIQDPTNCNRFEITDNGNAQMGYLWNATKVNLKNDFYVSTFMTFGTKDGGGADGIAFSLQPVSNKEGATGEGLGVEGVSPLFGVEYDTYQNGAKNDPSYDHMSFFSHITGLNHNGVSYTNSTQIVAGQNDVEDGQWYAMKFNWNSQTQTFTVFDGCSVRMSKQIDLINDIFAGDSMVFWGFTASTGAYSNVHQVELEFAHFGLTDTLMCKNDTITPNIVVNTNSNYVYHWSPAQGVSDTTLLNPTITNDTNTTYYLTVYNECGVLVVTDSIKISVKPDPNPFDIKISDVFCTTDSLLVSIVEGIPNSSYQWIVGNDTVVGLQSYIPFDDSLLVQAQGLTDYGCVLNKSKTIYAELPANDFSLDLAHDTLCAGDSVQVTVSGTDISNWTPAIYTKHGDTIHNYQGNFDIDSSQYIGVTLVSEHGCVYQDSSFVFKANLQPVIDVVDSICLGQSVTLNVLGVDISNWLGIGQGTVTVTPDSSFEYEVVVSEYGCIDTLKQLITVLPLPQIDINSGAPNAVCDGEALDIPVSTVANGFSLIQYVWDGLLPETITTVGDTVISKTFNHQGNPNEMDEARLLITSVTDAFGCVANLVDSATIKIASIPQITNVASSALQVCDGDTVELALQTTGVGPLTYTYTKDGGTNVYSQSQLLGSLLLPMAHINGVNEQTIVDYDFLSITDTMGCEAATNVRVSITINPLPQFFNLTQNATEFCDGDSLHVQYELTGVGNLTLNYEENGSNSVNNTTLKAIDFARAMNHTGDVNTLDTYQAKFNQVTDSLGCKTAVNDSVEVSIRPIPQLTNFNLSNNQVCDGEQVILSYEVTGFENLQVVESYDGTADTVVNTVGTITSNETMAHTGDANQVTLHQFELVAVSDAFGCNALVNEVKQVSVNPLPQFFNLTQNATEFCDGDSLHVQYELTGVGNLTLNYEENGSNSVNNTALKAIDFARVMNHTGDVNTLDTYQAKFNQVTDSLGCKTAVNDSVEVSIRPIPNVISFETDQNKVCNNNAVEVSSSFSGVGTLLVDFGLDNSFTSKTISQLAFDTTLTLVHTGNENEVSNYALQVVGVVDGFGCSSPISMAKDVIVHPTPSYNNVWLNKTAFCENDTILFETNYSGIAPFQVAFNRDDSLIQLTGNALSNATNWEASHELSNKNEQQTVQMAMLTIQDSLGCLGTTNPSVTYTVNPTPNMAWKELTNHAFCDGDSLLLSAELTGAGNLLAGIDNANMQAIAGNLNIPVLASHVGNQNEVGVQAFTLLNIEDELGCSNTANDTLKIKVNPLPSLNAFETNKNHVCEGESVNLVYKLTGVLPLDVTTSEFGNTVVNQVNEYQNTFAKQLFHFGNPNQTNQYDFFITAVVDSLGCAKEINEQASVTVNPLPKITTIGFNDDEICSGDNTQLNFTTTGVALSSMEITINNVDTIINNLLYADSFQVNFIHQGNNNAKHLLAVSGVEIMDSLGCFTNSSAFDSIAIRPLPQITNSVLSNSHVCDGDSVMLFTEVTGMLPLHVIYNEGTDSLYLLDYLGTQVFEVKHQAEQSNYDTLFINTNSITDDFGCASAMNAEQIVLVNPTPKMVQSNVNDSMFCDGEELQLHATFTGIMPLSMTYANWNGNNGDWLLNNSELYLSTVVTHVGSNDSLSIQQFSMYQITDELGCNATLNDVSEILVRPLPSIEQVLFDKEAYCEGDSMLLSIDTKGVGLLTIETNSVLNEVYSGLSEQKIIAEHTVEKLQKDTLQFMFGAITDDFGCSTVNGINKIVTVNPTPGITSFEFADNWVCENDEVELQLSVQGIMPLLVNIKEQGQDTVLALNNPTFFHSWVAKHQGDKNKSAISKLTAMQVSDELGCKAEIEQVAQLMVNPLPTFTNAFDDSLSFCDNGSLGITNLSTGVLPLHFDYECNNVAEQLLMQTHEFDLSQNMHYVGMGDEVAVQNVVWKSITDSLGCKSAINEVSNISIYPNPTVQIAAAKNMWCESDTIDWLYEVKGIGNVSLEYLLNDLNQDLLGVAKQGVIRQTNPISGVNNLNMTHVVDNAFGCKTSVSEMDSVQVFLNPQVDFSGETSVCEGDEVRIQFKGVEHAVNFTMLIDNVLYSGLDSSSNMIIQAIADTVIHFQQVINEDAPNCSTALNQSFYKINVEEAPKVTYTLPEIVCENDMATLQLINTSDYDKINVSYLINGDSSAVELKSKAIDKTFRIKANTTVIIQSAIGTSSLKCLKTYNDTLFIKKLELPNALFEINPAVVDLENREAQVFNKSFRAVHYEWEYDYGIQRMNDDEENPLFKFPDEAGEYEVVLLATAENGCVDEMKRIVVVKDKLLVFVPNAFTPNGDNYNAIFKPVLNHDHLVYYEFQVYNRWGELIYETVQTTEGWDGTYAGQQVPNGIYVWTVNARLRGDAMELVNKEGKVTIIR